MKPKRWQLNSHEGFESFGTSRPLTSVLMNRGFHALEDMEDFLNIDWDHLNKPWQLPDMDKVLTRLERALQEEESVWIYGDYDVDGMTSTAILYRGLKHLGMDVHYYIPRRQDEGYGLNSDAIRHLANSGANVVITVDCGITAVEQAQLAKSLNLDLIITDHHECMEVLPDAYALVNPKLPYSNYPFTMLAGAGIALKVAQAILQDRFSEIAQVLVALSAIGTIADVAPLNGENRIIAALGLSALTQLAEGEGAQNHEVPHYYPVTWQHSACVGLKALVHQCQLDKKDITAGHVGFMIGPRLNAVGRLEHAQAGVDLLITDDLGLAQSIAKHLDQLNKDRQQTEQSILEEALQMIGQDALHLQSGTIVVWGRGWHTGVVGIVASRLVERFYRPVIVLSENEGLLKGSARSIAGYSMFEALLAQKDWLLKFGGHEQAAGLTLEAQHLPALLAGLTAYNLRHLTSDLLIEKIACDALVDTKEINHRLLSELSRLEPYGMGNPKPIFRIDHVRVDEARRLGKDGSHLKLMLNDHYRLFEALQFKYGERPLPEKNYRMDLTFQLELNNFNGVESVQMHIKDMRSYHPMSSVFNQEVYITYLCALLKWIAKTPVYQQNTALLMQSDPGTRESRQVLQWILEDQTMAIWSYEALLEVAYARHDLGLGNIEDVTHLHICKEVQAQDAIYLDLPLNDSLGWGSAIRCERRLDHQVTENLAQNLIFDRSYAADLFTRLKKEHNIDVHMALLASKRPELTLLTFMFFEEAGFAIRQGPDLVLAPGPYRRFSYEESLLCQKINHFIQHIQDISIYLKNRRDI